LSRARHSRTRSRSSKLAPGRSRLSREELARRVLARKFLTLARKTLKWDEPRCICDRPCQKPLAIVDYRGIIVDNRGIVVPKPSDLLQGTLDLLILKTIAREPLHGWGIAKRIAWLSGDVLAVGQGSLYPALHRLEQQGWIKAEWRDSELGRAAKFYALTRDGRKQLGRELDSWNRLSSAVRLLIQNA
jgi:PadR family transcriptional regulator, regulatory protein PadR